jgi:hypothetical protein
MRIRNLSVLVAGIAALGANATVLAGTAKAGMIAEYQADADPTTEGFTAVSFNTPSTVGPIPSDLGLPAWSITGSDQTSEFGYASPSLTGAQQAAIAANGFTLTLVARAIQNVAPAFTSSMETWVAGATVNYGGLRWIIALGIDAAGDTVVFLPTTYGLEPGGSVAGDGPSYTLVGSGSSYNTYQLAYDPTTGLANLFVNGTEEIAGYAGDTSFVLSDAADFDAVSGGQGNFNFVELASGPSPTVPEPTSLAIFASALVGLASGLRYKSRLLSHLLLIRP